MYDFLLINLNGTHFYVFNNLSCYITYCDKELFSTRNYSHNYANAKYPAVAKVIHSICNAGPICNKPPMLRGNLTYVLAVILMVPSQSTLHYIAFD